MEDLCGTVHFVWEIGNIRRQHRWWRGGGIRSGLIADFATRRVNAGCCLLRVKLGAKTENSGAKYRSVLEKSSSCAAHFFSSVYK
jgi:hypothetical protein